MRSRALGKPTPRCASCAHRATSSKACEAEQPAQGKHIYDEATVMREKLKRWHHNNWAEHVNDKDGAGNLRQQLFETPWVERELERRLEQDRRESAARGLGRCEVSSRPVPAAAATSSTPSRRARPRGACGPSVASRSARSSEPHGPW